VVDDFGRFNADPDLLLAACFPLRTKTVLESEIDLWLSELETAGRTTTEPGLIIRYEVAGKRYLELLKLGPPRAQNSKYPGPTRALANIYAHVQTSVPSSGSGSGSSSYSSTSRAAAVPKLPNVSRERAAVPAAAHLTETKKWEAATDRLAGALAAELVPLHWYPSAVGRAKGALKSVLAPAPEAVAETIRRHHAGWRAVVDKPKSIANQQFCYWISDLMYLSPPPGGADSMADEIRRLEQEEAEAEATELAQ